MTRFRNIRPRREISKREKVMLAAFLALLFSYLYYFFVLEGQLQRIEELRKEVARKEEIIREMYGRGYRDVSEMEEEIREYDRAIARARELVPNIKDTPGLLVDFYRMVKENHLYSESIAFGQLQAHKGYSTFTLKLKVKGPAGDVRNFLKEVESYRRALTINEVSFNPLPGGLLEADVGLVVFVMHDVAPDPLEYPFMGKRFGVEDFFDAFEYPAPEGGGGAGAGAGSAGEVEAPEVTPLPGAGALQPEGGQPAFPPAGGE